MGKVNKSSVQDMYSTWRVDDVIIDGNECFELDFLDTRPNMFVIQNPNPYDLKVSIANMPTPKNFEFLVGKNSTETLGRPMRTGRLYILNTGAQNIHIKVFSCDEDFDMNILKNLNVTLGDVSVTTDGIIKGFAEGVSLPSGDNTIGRVLLNTAIQQAIDNIKNYTKNVNDDTDMIKQIVGGMVEIVSQGTVLTSNIYGKLDGTKKLGTVSVDNISGDITVSDFQEKKCTAIYPYNYEVTGTTTFNFTSAENYPVLPSVIDHIQNYGETVLNVVFLDEGGVGGSPYKLRPGCILSDIKFDNTKIVGMTITPVSGTGKYNVLLKAF